MKVSLALGDSDAVLYIGDEPAAIEPGGLPRLRGEVTEDELRLILRESSYISGLRMDVGQGWVVDPQLFEDEGFSFDDQAFDHLLYIRR